MTRLTRRGYLHDCSGTDATVVDLAEGDSIPFVVCNLSSSLTVFALPRPSALLSPSGNKSQIFAMLSAYRDFLLRKKGGTARPTGSDITSFSKETSTLGSGMLSYS